MIVVEVETMARDFDFSALVVLVVTVVDAEVSCDIRFTVGDLTRATGDLPAFCHRNMRLCTHGGLGSCAFIAITRHIQVPTGQRTVCEFDMNVLVCFCLWFTCIAIAV